MSNIASSRPQHLPDFKQPPLNEVVIGIQFAKPAGYQQIHAGEVWNLFRKDYPQVQEQAPLAPAFETFGLSVSPAPISFVTGASHDRFWFLRPQGEELIQFQNDRLLHNWRKIGSKENSYPRFEYMIKKFKEEIERLQEYVNMLVTQTLAINQCEISYINHIVFDENVMNASNWFKFVTFGNSSPDDFKISFREIMLDKANAPQGRLIVELVTARNQSGQKIIAFTLTVRGAPKEPNIESAIDFISSGRELIVNKFAELTTDYAHAQWGRIT